MFDLLDRSGEASAEEHMKRVYSAGAHWFGCNGNRFEQHYQFNSTWLPYFNKIEWSWYSFPLRMHIFYQCVTYHFPTNILLIPCLSYFIVCCLLLSAATGKLEFPSIIYQSRHVCERNLFEMWMVRLVLRPSVEETNSSLWALSLELSQKRLKQVTSTH